MAKLKGKIKFFNSTKGFGFITPDSGGKELFFHMSHFNGDTKTIRDGQVVEYSEGQGRKGTEAIDVSPSA